MKNKYFFAAVKAINEDERTLDAVASTSDMDRDGDIILPSAFEKSLQPFKDNPVILAGHQHRLASGSSPVIGSAIPDSIRTDKKQMTFTMRFADTPLGNEYWQLYKDRHMRAFSVGFMPIEWTDEKDEKLGYIRTYTKIELLEISAVPVPSNRLALVRMKGFYEVEDAKDSAVESVKSVLEATLKSELDKFTIRIEDSLDDIKSLLIADSDGFAKTLLGESFESPESAGDLKNAEQLKQIINTVNQLNT